MLNIYNIIKNCAIGTKFYHVNYGEVTLHKVHPVEKEPYPLEFNGGNYSTTVNGLAVEGLGECIIFPSKENRSWALFKYEIATPKNGDYMVLRNLRSHIFIWKDERICHVLKTSSATHEDLLYDHREQEIDLALLEYANGEEIADMDKILKLAGKVWNSETLKLEDIKIELTVLENSDGERWVFPNTKECKELGIYFPKKGNVYIGDIYTFKKHGQFERNATEDEKFQFNQLIAEENGKIWENRWRDAQIVKVPYSIKDAELLLGKKIKHCHSDKHYIIIGVCNDRVWVYGASLSYQELLKEYETIDGKALGTVNYN